MPKVPNLFVPSEQLRPVQMPAMQAPGVQPYVETQSQQIEKLGAGMERLGQGAMSFSGDMRAVERLQAQEAERKAQAAMRTQDRIDDSKTKEADAAFSEFSRALLQDPEKGYLNKKGQGAIDTRSSTIEAFDKQAKATEDSLQNETQRNNWRYNIARRRIDFMSHVDGHFSSEAKNSDIQATKAHINASRNDAVMALQSTDPKIQAGYTTFRNTIRDNVNHLAQLQGIPIGSDQHRLMMLDETTQLHSDAINSYLSNEDSKGASEYFDKIKDSGEISESAKSALGATIRKYVDKDEGASLGLQLMASKPSASTGSYSDIKTSERSQRISQGYEAITNLYAQINDKSISTAVGLRAIDTVSAIMAKEDERYVREGNDVLARGVKWLNDNPTQNLSDNIDLHEEAKAYGKSDDLAKYSATRDIATNQNVLGQLRGYTDKEWRSLDANDFTSQYFTKLSRDDMSWAIRKIATAQNRATPNDMQKALQEDLLQEAAINAGYKIIGSGQDPEHQARFLRIKNNYWKSRLADPDISTPKLIEQVMEPVGPESKPVIISGLSPQERGELEFTTKSGTIYKLREIPPEELLGAKKTISQLNADAKNPSQRIPDNMEMRVEIYDQARQRRLNDIANNVSTKLLDAGIQVKNNVDPKLATINVIDAQHALGMTASEIEERLKGLSDPRFGGGYRADSGYRKTEMTAMAFAAIQEQVILEGMSLPTPNQIRQKVGGKPFYDALREATGGVDVDTAISVESAMRMFFSKPDDVDPAYFRHVLQNANVNVTKNNISTEALREQYIPILKYVRESNPKLAK
jgi:hypothetical protein